MTTKVYGCLIDTHHKVSNKLGYEAQALLRSVHGALIRPDELLAFYKKLEAALDRLSRHHPRCKPITLSSPQVSPGRQMKEVVWCGYKPIAHILVFELEPKEIVES